MKPCILLLASLALPLSAGEVTVPITNPLNLDWPWELVHRDLPAGSLPAQAVARFHGETRPVQIEALPDGRQRAWFIATLAPAEKGRRSDLSVTLGAGNAPNPLTVEEQPDALVIANGVNRLRLPRVVLSAPKPFKELPPPIAGCAVTNEPGWYGRAWFEGDASVTAVRTEVIARGPVFVSVRVTYAVAGQPTASPATIVPVPGLVWPPAEHAGRCFYETTLRVVAGDPWIDVEERYSLPTKVVSWLELKDVLKPDAALWIRWFGWEAFGGNTDLKIAPLEPLPKQRGPFVMLRPIWNQGPGGGQDFIVSRGLDANADPQAPAVGAIAVRPTRWYEPWAQTIACFAENRDTARLRFEVERGMRAWGFYVGERWRVDSTGKLNAMVRRHSDWTLDKQLNDYVLEWPRDAAKAGPHIVMTRDELAAFRQDHQAGRDTPAMRTLKEFIARKDQLKGLDRDLVELITGGKPKGASAPAPNLWLDRRYQDDFLNPTGQTRRMKSGWPLPDLLADGQPLGGPMQAAIGYIFSDLDQWIGYYNGWGPGNPNFHTDKYMIAAMTAAALLDHPHAKRWLDFAKQEFDEDAKRVLLAPDGVGYECPGYSTYSLNLLLELAHVFLNTGYGNPIAENPLFAKTGTWHRHLLTPVDRRIGIRHQAPIGDTHRWGGNDGEVFGALAKFHAKADPAFASEMMAVWRLFRDQGMRGTVLSDLVNVDQTIAPTPLDKLDWGSHAFQGFGTIMRSRFGTPREGFVTFRAGAAVGHAHNEQLSFHFYGAGMPAALDYNCSYHPRGDHAALHNTMTFGGAGPFTHHGDAKPVEAMEQLIASGRLLRFASTPVADVAVGEVSGDQLTLTPVKPEEAKFQYPYPSRKVAPITHRRWFAFIKHPADSRLEDYLVVRDETTAREPQHVNLHLLGREPQVALPFVRAAGQLDNDLTLFVAHATKPTLDAKRWFYYDEWMNGPGKWKLAGKGNDPEKQMASDAENADWLKQIHDSDGRALIPPVDWKERWEVGECQQWLRLSSTPGTPVLWVLYARKAGSPEPEFTAIADGVRVRLDTEVDEVVLSGTAAMVRQQGTETAVITAGALPALGTAAP